MIDVPCGTQKHKTWLTDWLIDGMINYLVVLEEIQQLWLGLFVTVLNVNAAN